MLIEFGTAPQAGTPQCASDMGGGVGHDGGHHVAGVHPARCQRRGKAARARVKLAIGAGVPPVYQRHAVGEDAVRADQVAEEGSAARNSPRVSPAPVSSFIQPITAPPFMRNNLT